MDFYLSKLLIIPGIVVGISFHEFAHAKVAHLLGDDTAKNMGRVTLDPASHIDILGFLMLFVAGFGWGKAVPVNENNFKKIGRDNMLVSLAGPFMNLFVAIAFLLIMKITYLIQPQIDSTRVGEIIITIIYLGGFYNIVLMIFNLLPIPPLDGYHILSGIFDFRGKGFHYQLYEKGRILLILLIITRVTKYLMGPIYFIFDNLAGIIL